MVIRRVGIPRIFCVHGVGAACHTAPSRRSTEPSRSVAGQCVIPSRALVSRIVPAFALVSVPERMLVDQSPVAAVGDISPVPRKAGPRRMVVVDLVAAAQSGYLSTAPPSVVSCTAAGAAAFAAGDPGRR